LSRAKDIKDAFKVCPTPDPCLLVEGQRHMRFPGVPRTKSAILLTIRIHQIWWRVTGLPTTVDAFNAIPRRTPDHKKRKTRADEDHQDDYQAITTKGAAQQPLYCLLAKYLLIITLASAILIINLSATLLLLCSSGMY
jgi:hypothetical protein